MPPTTKKAVKDGATYEAWKFADDAKYWSPYFGNHIIDLKTNPISVAASATMEAKAYSLKFPDWGPVEFKCWPSDNGFVMKTLFQGHTKDGKEMSFFAYGFVETNDQGEITVGKRMSTEMITVPSSMSPLVCTAPSKRAPIRICRRSVEPLRRPACLCRSEGEGDAFQGIPIEPLRERFFHLRY